MASQSQIYAGAFADPVFAAQSVFRSLMDGGLLKIQTAPATRTRRLAIDGNDLMTRLGQSLQGRHGKIRRSHEDDAKSHSDLHPDRYVLKISAVRAQTLALAALVNFLMTISRFNREI